MRRGIVIFNLLAICSFPVSFAYADPATTQPVLPATQASTQPAAELPANSPIRTWLNNLASPDASVREQAQTQLMGISRSELDGLRLLIQKTSLVPAQVNALHDIVTHAFLAGETYEAAPGQAFLGIRWYTPDVDDLNIGPPRLGVPVEQRIPGFPSFQSLRNGDLILGVLVEPNAPIQQLPNMQTPTRRLLITAVSQAGSAKVLVLQILRQGQPLRVPVRLAPKPVELAGNDIGHVEQFLSDRMQRAEEFWQANFVPLLRQNVS